MATTAGDRQRALSYVRTLELMVGDLPEVAAEWDEISEGERESWSHDWDNEMGGLERLADYVAHGVLEQDELERYAAVVRTLRDLSPVIARLDLQPPPLTAKV